MILRSVFAVGVVFLLSSSSPAATSKQYNVTKDSQAVVVATAAFTAMGGTQALLSYQDSQASGTLTLYPKGSTPVSYPITLKTKTTQLTRVEVQKSNGTNVRILNNGQAAIERPDGTVVHLLMNNTVSERVGHIPLLSLLAEYPNSNIQLAYQGVSQVNGQNADSIGISFVPTTDPVQGPFYAALTRASFYVDQATGLVDEVQYSNYAENDSASSQNIQVYLTQYQTMNGISVPFHITTYADGVLDSDIVLSSISFNVGLPDSDFVLPQ